ncbi:MAG: hypothetical protein AAGF14_08500, partial [Pseudomonadota bacterium]
MDWLGDFKLVRRDRYFSGWMNKLTQVLDTENHVSDISRFAVLAPSGDVILRSSNYRPEALGELLKESRFQAELHTAMG